MAVCCACENRFYDAGDGKYSFLYTDYVDVDVKGGIIHGIVTDDGTSLNIPQGKRLDIEPKDTMLRWLLYYNKRNANTPIEIVGNTPVRILHPYTAEEVKTIKTDAVKVTSVWQSANGKYLNLRLGLMTGNATSPDQKQQLFLVRTACHSINKGKATYTLYHDQHDVPQYYTQEYFFSMPYPIEQDTVEVHIQTYSGEFIEQYIRQ